MLTVTSDLFIIVGFAVIAYAYYRYLPKVGRKIGIELVRGALQGLGQVLMSGKMKLLGEKGVAARQFEAIVSEKQGIVVPLVGTALTSWVKERFGTKAAAKIEAAIEMVPFDADPIIFANLPQLAEKLGGLVGKGGEAKALAEELRMLTKVGAEPVK